MSTLRLSTPITVSNHPDDDFVRLFIGDCSMWMPCVIRDDDLPRLRDWLNETIIARATADYAYSR